MSSVDGVDMEGLSMAAAEGLSMAAEDLSMAAEDLSTAAEGLSMAAPCRAHTMIHTPSIVAPCSLVPARVHGTGRPPATTISSEDILILPAWASRVSYKAVTEAAVWWDHTAATLARMVDRNTVVA